VHACQRSYRIVYDGLLSSYSISFGGGIRRMLNKSYNEAKARHGIVTSLPMSAQPTPVQEPKAQPARKPPSKEDTAGEGDGDSSPNFLTWGTRPPATTGNDIDV